MESSVASVVPRFQAASGSHDAGYLRENGIDLRRRPTGGRAVLHEPARADAHRR